MKLLQIKNRLEDYRSLGLLLIFVIGVLIWYVPILLIQTLTKFLQLLTIWKERLMPTSTLKCELCNHTWYLPKEREVAFAKIVNCSKHYCPYFSQDIAWLNNPGATQSHPKLPKQTTAVVPVYNFKNKSYVQPEVPQDEKETFPPMVHVRQKLR